MEIFKDINGRTRIYGIIGNPIEHTLSPYLHNTISKYNNENTVYIPFKVESCNLQNLMKMFLSLPIYGFNVTVPHKNAIINYLDEISVDAKLMGAVNTINFENGKFKGYNTDGDGFIEAFKNELGCDLVGKRVAILGAGGTCRSICVKMAIEGVHSIYIINRTVKKAVDISDVVNSKVRDIVKAIELEKIEVQRILDECDIIVNTTSLGMYPEVDSSPINDSIKFPSHKIVYDVIYSPYETKFLKTAKLNKNIILNGLSMLYYQGIAANEIWNERKLDKDFKDKLYLNFSKMLSK